MEPTLVILAAGMASRYGSMKQVEAFGPSGETIIDYSINDAINAGFKKVVFIIRESFAEPFKAIFEPKLKGKVATEYVYQELDAHLGEYTLPADRTKPWGTAHAVLCCKDVVNEPFAVINADDFYGKEGIEKAYQFLTTQCNDKTYGIIAYKLKNTLSENGSVSRGVCEVDVNGNLTDINERTKIYREPSGTVVYEEEDGVHELNENVLVSMNLLCFHNNVLDLCETQFKLFLKDNIHLPKSEFFIPLMNKYFIEQKLGNVKVTSTDSKWFGVTYKEDAPGVKANISNLIEQGVYSSNIWGK